MTDPKRRRCSVSVGLEPHLAIDWPQPQSGNRGWPEVRTRINVNTGRVSLGNRRSETRVAHAVIDDAAES